MRQSDDLDKFDTRTTSVQGMQFILEAVDALEIQNLKVCVFSPPRDLTITIPQPEWESCGVGNSAVEFEASYL